jgi:hypothetical protein
MLKKDDGGPAFPRAPFDVNDYCGDGSPGMSLRDWFAGEAPEPPEWWFIQQTAEDRRINPHNDPHKTTPRSTLQLIAEWKYLYADAMIAQRKKA